MKAFQSESLPVLHNPNVENSKNQVAPSGHGLEVFELLKAVKFFCSSIFIYMFSISAEKSSCLRASQYLNSTYMCKNNDLKTIMTEGLEVTIYSNCFFQFTSMTFTKSFSMFFALSSENPVEIEIEIGFGKTKILSKFTYFGIKI